MSTLVLHSIPGLAFCTYLGLFVFVILRGRRDQITRSFGWYLVLMAAWSLGSLLMRLDTQHIWLWWRIVALGAMGFLAPLLSFVRCFLGVHRPRWVQWVVSTAFVLVGIPLSLQASGTMAVSGVSGGMVEYQLGPLVYLSGTYFIGTYLVIIGYLVVGYRRAPDPIERNRIRYPLLGLSISLLCALTNSAPALGAYPLDIAGNLINSMLLAYAVARHDLLDLRLVLRRGLALGLIIFVAGVVYVFSLVVAVALVDATWLGVLITVVLAISMTAALVPNMMERAQAVIDRLFFRERYDSARMLREVSAASLTLRPLDELGQMLVGHTCTAMRAECGAFFVRVQPGGDIRLVAQTGYEPPLPGLRMRADHPLIQYLARREQVVPQSRLRLAPQFQSLRTDEHADLECLRGDLFVGVPDADEPLGLFVFGPRRSQVPYSADDHNVLATLANQTAVSLANARLYGEIRSHARELEQANEELRQLDRMKDEFIQTVSHELRTPITFVRGYVELLLEGEYGALNPGQMAAMETVARGTTGVVALVNDVIAATKNADQELAISWLDLGQVARAAAQGAQAAAERAGIAMAIEVPEDLPGIRGDARRLTQVFNNLIGNAIKFSLAGDTVTVRIAVEGSTISCSVRDTGIGIAEDQQERVWDRFYQVEQGSHRRFGGTGLGLAIVKRIVEAHGGSVSLESEPGRGSTFFAVFPIPQDAQEEGIPVARGPGEGCRSATGACRAVVVDGQ